MEETKMINPLVAIEKIHIRLDEQLTELIPYLKVFTESSVKQEATELVQLGSVIESFEARYRKSFKTKPYRISKPYLVKRHIKGIDSLVKETRKINVELLEATNLAKTSYADQEILLALEEKSSKVKELTSLWRKAKKALIE